MGFAVEECTIGEIHDAFRAGTITSVALTQAYLDRIEAYDQQGPALNSYVAMNPDALADAAKCDEALKDGGTLIGPLHGVPVCIKDQAEMAGVKTSFGVAALEGYVPSEDSTVVAKLREAGAVIIGKTTMPDFAASWWGFGSVHGETKCPYDLDRDSGGSSGGTGSAIGANLAAVGVGEDTGGSIRLPSGANNLFGIRVTPGTISRKGLSPLLVLLDTAGPMARTVTDGAVLLDALVGYDAADPYTVTHTIGAHQGSYTAHLTPGGLEGARFGFIKEAFGSDDDPDCAQVNKVVRSAIEGMKSAGAQFVELSVPDLATWIADTSLYISRSRHDVDNFLKSRPSIPYDTVEAIVKEGKYEKRLGLIPAMVEDGPADPDNDPEYFRRLAKVHDFQRMLVGMMAANGLDGLCHPCCRILTPTHEDLRGGKWDVLSFPTNTVIASQSLLPSVCVPAGFSGGGVPVGMEIVAPPYHEGALINFAYGFEQATNPRKPPTTAPAL